METVALLVALIAGVLGPILLFVAASMRFQHDDGTKTRKLVTDSKEEILKLIAESRTETREHVAGSKTRTQEHVAGSETRSREHVAGSKTRTRKHVAGSETRTQELIDRNHQELSSSLADARERLALIEGYLRIAPPQRQPRRR